MILNKTPLSLAEVKAHIKDHEDKQVLVEYLNNFSKIEKKDAEELAEAVRKLNNPKVKEENIIKIVDFLPKDLEDVNKLFTEVSLSDEEAKAILDIVKKY